MHFNQTLQQIQKLYYTLTQSPTILCRHQQKMSGCGGSVWMDAFSGGITYNFQQNRIMQQISQTQHRLEHRVDSQRIRNKFKMPALYTPERLKTNPQSDRKNSMTPGRLYLRSVDDHKYKKYYTIDTDLEPVHLQGRQERAELKGFERLPQIRHNKPRKDATEPKREKRYLSYKNPTINSLLHSEGKQKNMRKYDFKRICSVNCITRQQKNKKKKDKQDRQEEQSDSHVRQNALKRYLANQYKARYPSTQVKNYLARMKHEQMEGKQMEVQEDRNYYQTFFGLQPEFYKLLTEYAIEASVPKHFESSRFTSYNTAMLPTIPSRQDIAGFIENYVSIGKDINIQKLIKQPNFLVQYTPSEMYFGQMVSSADNEDNIRDGIGILLTKTSCFEGIFQNNQKLKGCEVNYSGIYRGQFKNNKKDGTGQFEWSNGEYYIGDWKDGQRHGNGVWTNKTGDSYNGEWIKGKSEGTGIYISQGRQYRGDFVDFKKDGWGKQKLANEDVYQGGFKDGLPHGKGIYIWSNGTKYEGEFISGFRNGKGILSTIDGFVYNGQFFDEKPQGLCEIFMPNGDIYQGYLRNGKKNGRGILMLKHSRRNLDGFWQNDMFISAIK